MVKCNDCKQEFRQNERGCRRLPIHLCPGCVLKRNRFQCRSCDTWGCIKDNFYRRSCFQCNKKECSDGCSECIPYVEEVMGIEFELCEEHKGNTEDMEEMAINLIEDEKETASLHRKVQK